MNTNSKYPYVLAIVFGLLIPFIPDIEPFPIPLGLMYLFGGSLFGFLWPKQSWRWGLWIVGPMIVFIGLSVLFAGQLEMFLKKDLPILILAITSACLGSFILSWVKHLRTKAT
ncbi:MAG: hypothetical protein ABIO81_12050 [Ginsengibacter sp.]